MKYFRYPFKNKINRNLIKERVKKYQKDQKRNYYISKVLEYLAVLTIVAIMLLIVFSINYISKNINNDIFQVILIILLVILFFPLSLAISFFIFVPLFKLFPYNNLPEVTKEIINKVTKPLKKYYNISDDFIVTKCYESTNSLIVNKDVILYIYQNRIRIVNDFTRSTKDFGCYEFHLEEVKIYNKVESDVVSTIIEHDKESFELGKRARTFIFKNYNIDSKSYPLNLEQ